MNEETPEMNPKETLVRLYNNGTKIQVEEFKDRFRVTSYEEQRLPNQTILWPDEAEGLRIFFQEKRDRALDRWRDPVNPDMVCYPVDNSTLADVRVLDERTGASFFYTRDSILDQKYPPSFETANRYYTSHPIMRPWEDAKEGEYWLVTWSHLPTPEPCAVVSVENKLFFKGVTQCRVLSSRYIKHAQKLITEDD